MWKQINQRKTFDIVCLLRKHVQLWREGLLPAFHHKKRLEEAHANAHQRKAVRLRRTWLWKSFCRKPPPEEPHEKSPAKKRPAERVSTWKWVRLVLIWLAVVLLVFLDQQKSFAYLKLVIKSISQLFGYKKTETDTEQNKKTKGQAKLASQILDSYPFDNFFDMALWHQKKDTYELKDVALKYIFTPGRQKEMKLDRLRR